jgi:hypothetical protein
MGYSIGVQQEFLTNFNEFAARSLMFFSRIGIIMEFNRILPSIGDIGDEPLLDSNGITMGYTW